MKETEVIEILGQPSESGKGGLIYFYRDQTQLQVGMSSERLVTDVTVNRFQKSNRFAGSAYGSYDCRSGHFQLGDPKAVCEKNLGAPAKVVVTEYYDEGQYWLYPRRDLIVYIDDEKVASLELTPRNGDTMKRYLRQ